jgi:nitrogen fixation NifU-like protein
LDTRLYTRIVVDHFWNPRNLRAMPDASAEGRAINRACSDVVRLFIKVEDGVITDSSFQAQGCVACVAAASMTTELAQGRALGDGDEDVLGENEVVEALGGLPAKKVECSVIAPNALRSAVQSFREKQ